MADSLYMWVQAAHVLAILAWMAGLFYLPRLFVYHAQVAVGSPESEVFKTMERRLLRAIMNPAMIATWVFGLWLLALNPAWFSEGWLHVKLLAVVLMTGMHMAMAKWRRQFANDENTRGHKFYRVMNEVPTVLVIIIVIMVVVKPF